MALGSKWPVVGRSTSLSCVDVVLVPGAAVIAATRWVVEAAEVRPHGSGGRIVGCGAGRTLPPQAPGQHPRSPPAPGGPRLPRLVAAALSPFSREDACRWGEGLPRVSRKVSS